MSADVAVGTVYIGVGHQEGFAEVKFVGFELRILFQRFALEECQRRICPAQQVPELFWFLMLVTGLATTVVNTRVSLGRSFFLGAACTAPAKARPARARVKNCFINVYY